MLNFATGTPLGDSASVVRGFAIYLTFILSLQEIKKAPK
jgi:hypothetical protein